MCGPKWIIFCSDGGGIASCSLDIRFGYAFSKGHRDVNSDFVRISNSLDSDVDAFVYSCNLYYSITLTLSHCQKIDSKLIVRKPVHYGAYRETQNQVSGQSCAHSHHIPLSLHAARPCYHDLSHKSAYTLFGQVQYMYTIYQACTRQHESLRISVPHSPGV